MGSFDNSIFVVSKNIFLLVGVGVYNQFAKTIVVRITSCAWFEPCDWTPCDPLVIQDLHVFSIVNQVHFIIITVIVYIC